MTAIHKLIEKLTPHNFEMFTLGDESVRGGVFLSHATTQKNVTSALFK
jgi:hypothetical protein